MIIHNRRCVSSHARSPRMHKSQDNTHIAYDMRFMSLRTALCFRNPFVHKCMLLLHTFFTTCGQHFRVFSLPNWGRSTADYLVFTYLSLAATPSLPESRLLHRENTQLFTHRSNKFTLKRGAGLFSQSSIKINGGERLQLVMNRYVLVHYTRNRGWGLAFCPSRFAQFVCTHFDASDFLHVIHARNIKSNYDFFIRLFHPHFTISLHV